MTSQPLSGPVPCDFRANRSSHGEFAGRVPLVESLASVRGGVVVDADVGAAAAGVAGALAGAWLEGESDSLDGTVTAKDTGEVGNGLAAISLAGRGAEAMVLGGVARITTARHAMPQADFR
jgi:hypothetical protein